MNESPTIYTDLDGTLLDHETYSAEAARTVLDSVSYTHLTLPTN